MLIKNTQKNFSSDKNIQTAQNVYSLNTEKRFVRRILCYTTQWMNQSPHHCQAQLREKLTVS